MAGESGWGDKGAWAVTWQKEGTGVSVEFIAPHRLQRFIDNHELPHAEPVVFGLSGTAEEAMERVAKRLVGDPSFKKRWAGGAFRPIPYHLGIHVSRDSQPRVTVYPNEGQL